MDSRLLRASARLAYLAVILLATLSDLHFSPNRADAADRAIRALAEPLTWSDVIDGLRNVALFSGFGAVWVVTSLARRSRWVILLVTLLGFGLSVIVEGIQTFSPVRVASLMDVLTDTFGTLAGAVAMGLFLAAARRARGLASAPGTPAFLLAVPYGIAALCEALTPLFHSALIPGATGGPGARWHLALQASVPLSFLEVPLFDVVLFIPAGVLAVMLAAERRRQDTRWWPLVALAMAPPVVLAHVVHGAWGLPIRWEAVAIDVVALGAGAWAGHRWLDRMRAALGAARAFWCYAVLLVLWGWRPLLPETRLESIAEKFSWAAFAPLRLLSSTESVFSAVHVSQQFLLYLPLGALLARRAHWPAARGTNAAEVLALVVAIEVGHFFVSGRTFDITNALIAMSGLGMGWIVARRAESPAES